MGEKGDDAYRVRKDTPRYPPCLGELLVLLHLAPPIKTEALLLGPSLIFILLSFPDSSG